MTLEDRQPQDQARADYWQARQWGLPDDAALRYVEACRIGRDSEMLQKRCEAAEARVAELESTLSEAKRDRDEARKERDWMRENAERQAGYNAEQHAKCIGFVNELQGQLIPLRNERDQARAELEAATKGGAWVKCSERMPAVGSLVLTIDADDESTALVRYYDGSEEDPSPWQPGPRGAFEGYKEAITHWMPLPPAPDQGRGVEA